MGIWPFTDRRITKGGPQNAGFQETILGVQYKGVHRNKRDHLPDPGAQAYAYETYGLVAMPPSGPSIVALAWRPRAYYSAPAVSRPGLLVRGIPTVAGQIFQQPLLNPYAESAKRTGGGQV